MARKNLLRNCVATLAVVHSALSYAQEFPSKPLFIQHGLAAGGQTDISIRVLADALSRKLNVPVVVQAKPGAAQAIAVAGVAKANPDGYTIGHFYQGAFSTVPLLQEVSYTLDDLSPIIAWQLSPQVLAVRSDSPLKNLADLVAAAKANPEIPFGHQGKGSVTFMAPTVFAKEAGIRLNGIQYKGDADTAAALLGGHIPTASITEVAAGPLLESGKIRVLVTYAKVRSPNFPEIPTFEDQGFKVPIQVPVGILFAPKNTPAPVMKKLHDSVREVIQDEKTKKEFATMKQVLYYMDSKSVRDLIDNERKTYYPILKDAGLTK